MNPNEVDEIVGRVEAALGESITRDQRLAFALVRHEAMHMMHSQHRNGRRTELLNCPKSRMVEERAHAMGLEAEDIVCVSPDEGSPLGLPAEWFPEDLSINRSLFIDDVNDVRREESHERTVEVTCSTCSRSNDEGAQSCWWCGNRP